MFAGRNMKFHRHFIHEWFNKFNKLKYEIKESYVKLRATALFTGCFKCIRTTTKLPDQLYRAN